MAKKKLTAYAHKGHEVNRRNVPGRFVAGSGGGRSLSKLGVVGPSNRPQISPREGSAGDRIIMALQQATEAEQAGVHPSARFTVREVEMPNEPGEYSAVHVRQVRDLLNVSQAIFARLIGASESLVRAWEQGGREPNRMARRLLDDMRAQPHRWRCMLRSA
jgi:putative transcriptional regulator